jgi:methylenetetrahydrofolate reductase (NADPH)
MKVIDAINEQGDTVLSFEILPPLKGAGINYLYGVIDPLMKFNPKFVNVTYHREEYIYKKREKDISKRLASKKGQALLVFALQ